MSISTIEALEAMRAILNDPGIPSTADLGFILAVLRFEDAQVAEGDTATRPALDYARQHLKNRVSKAQKFVEWAEDNGLLARNAWKNIHLKAMHHHIDSLPPADLIECARCNGLRGSPLTCHVCNGQGYVFRMPAFWAVSSETLVARQEALDLQGLETPRSRRNFAARRAAGAAVREAYNEPFSDLSSRFPEGSHLGLAEEGLYPISHDDPALDGFSMGRVLDVRDGEVLVDVRQGFTLNGEDLSGRHMWMRPAPMRDFEWTTPENPVRLTSGDGEEYPGPLSSPLTIRLKVEDNITPVLQEIAGALQTEFAAAHVAGIDPADLQPGMMVDREVIPFDISPEDRARIDAAAEALSELLAPPVSSTSTDTEEPP